MPDATELAKLLVGLLFPALPFLMKVGEKVGEGVSVDAVKAVGKTAWNKAQSLWAKLSPQVQQKETAKQAANKAIQRPDEISQFALISEIRDILEGNPELAQDLLKLLQEQDSEHDDAVGRVNVLTDGVVYTEGPLTNTGNIIGRDQHNLGNK